ncbi:MAG: baseplate J/gp47 family protein [Myxococcales bacterium]|nr:baseplate J/gp47 family protein [Myxococcales bacterium]
MSYVAEPYAQFVDDLLTGLTGGVARERFVFLPENAPFDLSPPGPVIPRSLRLYGQVDGAFQRFVVDRDYTVQGGARVVWRADGDGRPAADARWPDEGTPWYANYEHAGPGGSAPRLTDRNPGSVTRLLAETFAVEYAVFSRQLEAVYRAAFLDTAGGRDLEQLVRLVGLERRQALYAVGVVTFGRRSPAPADIFVPAGTRLSTAEPPAAVFETTEPRTLRRGNLSVDAPVQALAPGPDGVVLAGRVRVIHQPILGIETVGNAQATRFGGSDESDEQLRSRARRALDGAGRATLGAMVAALTSLPGVREKDIRIAEDHLQSPGVVRLDVVVPELDEAGRIRAAELIEETRPAGIRVLHDLAPTRALSPAGSPPLSPPLADADPPAEDVLLGMAPRADGDLFPVAITLTATPTALDLTPGERSALEARLREEATAFVADAGVGEALVYNRLVARLMAVDGVLDVDVELSPHGAASPTKRRNVMPSDPGQRPRLAEPGGLVVRLGGAPLALDVKVRITLIGAGLVGDAATNLDAARRLVADALGQTLAAWPVDRTINSEALAQALADGPTYTVSLLSYKVDYVEAGVRILKTSPTIALGGLERLWLRTLEASA